MINCISFDRQYWNDSFNFGIVRSELCSVCWIKGYKYCFYGPVPLRPATNWTLPSGKDVFYSILLSSDKPGTVLA